MHDQNAPPIAPAAAVAVLTWIVSERVCARFGDESLWKSRVSVHRKHSPMGIDSEPGLTRQLHANTMTRILVHSQIP